ncbi:ubiquinol cytochrome c oxidoreductase [Helicobacter didelphidarum]|uniref:Ubiquinol cytochrome c oxidoreductase n=1 Tax=Helicobacter didelphidarum TaxID=2040648 RepID=A0A3D8INR3_9HELI|nr:c-type cytochrome [Helicobacter didelphidarum]RDU66753.1 ubiquinol cytochrome c oxidoreductase [Helicobacter didelphidarum]
MREIKIFVIVAFIIGVMYYGVEPLAHHAMHPATATSDYEFKDLEKFGKFDFSNADKEAGKTAFLDNCASCHTVASQNVPDLNARNPKTIQPAGEGGVVPPDLSNAGLIFDSQFLAHFIKDPVRATLLDSKFAVSCEGLDDENANKCEMANEGKESYPMNAFNGIMSDEEITNVVAYLKDIAPKQLNDKEVFVEACSRCHAAVYDKNQYDSKFFALHNQEVTNWIERTKNIKGEEAEATFLSSLNNEEHKFINSLLAMAKANEKKYLSEAEIDEKNDEINAKTIESYGLVSLLQNSLIESNFEKVGLEADTHPEFIKAYLGNTPPDLSMMIRSKGQHELAAFINNPQKVPLIDIQKAVINKLVRDKRDEEKANIPTNISDEEREDMIAQIDSRDAEYYKIKLPENTTKSEWQNNDDYTNMAREMGVMPFGKSMPRVGLTKEAEKQVVNYLETIGDSKKAERDSLGWWIMGFFVLLSVLAYTWKSKIWRDLH